MVKEAGDLRSLQGVKGERHKRLESGGKGWGEIARVLATPPWKKPFILRFHFPTRGGRAQPEVNSFGCSLACNSGWGFGGGIRGKKKTGALNATVM